MGSPNVLHFVDFPSPDPEACARFYCEVFRWETDARPRGIFHRMLPGGNYVNPDGSETQVGNLHMGAFRVDSAAPDPRPVPYPDMTPSGPAPRIYILVGDDDTEQAILARARDRGAEILWEDLYWDEFKGFHGAFRDPWGTLVIVWTKRREGDEVRPEQCAWAAAKGYPAVAQ
jgi:catechol 2,3-dioxygenase-like lactoylglutathione lyase family enzyme